MRVSTKCAVAVVNGSPVGCQSRHRARRSELSAKLTERGFGRSRASETIENDPFLNI